MTAPTEGQETGDAKRPGTILVGESVSEDAATLAAEMRGMSYLELSVSLIIQPEDHLYDCPETNFHVRPPDVDRTRPWSPAWHPSIASRQVDDVLRSLNEEGPGRKRDQTERRRALAPLSLSPHVLAYSRNGNKKGGT